MATAFTFGLTETSTKDSLRSSSNTVRGLRSLLMEILTKGNMKVENPTDMVYMFGTMEVCLRACLNVVSGTGKECG